MLYLDQKCKLWTILDCTPVQDSFMKALATWQPAKNGSKLIAWVVAGWFWKKKLTQSSESNIMSKYSPPYIFNIIKWRQYHVEVFKSLRFQYHQVEAIWCRNNHILAIMWRHYDEEIFNKVEAIRRRNIQILAFWLRVFQYYTPWERSWRRIE